MAKLKLSAKQPKCWRWDSTLWILFGKETTIFILGWENKGTDDVRCSTCLTQMCKILFGNHGQVSSALNRSHTGLTGRHAKAPSQRVLPWCILSPLLWWGRDPKTTRLDLRRDLRYLARKPNLLGDERAKQAVRLTSSNFKLRPRCSELHCTSSRLYIPGTVNPRKACDSARCQRLYLAHLNGTQGAVAKHSHLKSWEREGVGR